MPLRDHRKVRWPERRAWRSVLHCWTVDITGQLNQKTLPSDYLAIPKIFGGEVQPADPATILNTPAQMPIVFPSDLAELDEFAVEVREGWRLAAAVVLVSPGNKDSLSHRRALIAKCAAYLQNRVSVVVVDIVTEPLANLHSELIELFELGDPAKTGVSSDLYSVAYRPVSGDDGPARLEIWSNALQVGSVLPVMPLWIAPEVAVPLDLEASYMATCAALRMP